MDNKSYFYISGFISFSLFFCIIGLILLMIIFSTKTKNFALNKDNFISISLEQIDIQSITKVKNNITQEKIDNVVEEVKDVDIGSLFSDVWTKDIKIKEVKKEVVNNNRLDLIQKKIKISDKKTSSLVEKSDNTKALNTDVKAKKSSTSDEVNEYLAKIQATVYKHFSPPDNSQGYSVKAVIKLSAIGKVLDFRILAYSSNEALNAECDNIKDRLMGELFPKNPDNVSSNTIVYLVSQKN